ncbi:MAG: ATP-binding protein [Clostridiales bacterium]|nr:ATP-binding protein [Clostridiales bacterium]
MAYSTRILEKAKAILEQRREDAESEYEIRHGIVVARCPEIAEKEAQISSAGLDIIKSLGMSGEKAGEYVKELAEKNLELQREKAALIKANGFDEDYLEIPYTCKKCGDTGFKDGRFCECHLKLLQQLSFEELSQSSRLKLSSFDSFSLDYYKNSDDRKRAGQILETCKQYAKDFDRLSPNLYFYGRTGLGKTHLSLAIANEVIEKGFSVVYGSAQNLLSKIEREKFGRSDEPDGTTEEMLLSCDLLILDDLGAEFSTSFTVAAIYNIINTRLCDGLPMIINSNFSFAQLQEYYTPRIASRIIGDFTAIEFCGEDIRQLKAEE